jgi:hypothetical protein
VREVKLLQSPFCSMIVGGGFCSISFFKQDSEKSYTRWTIPRMVTGE